MADYYCRDELLWTDEIGRQDVRVVLLSLDVGNGTYVEDMAFAERPQDAGASGCGFYRKDPA